MKVEHEKVLSSFAFNFNLRHYNPEHVYTLELTVENIDFTLSKNRVFASEISMTLEGYKRGKTLNWEGTLSGDINYAYDGLASSFQMNTTFELEWASKSMKRAQMAGKIHLLGTSE